MVKRLSRGQVIQVEGMGEMAVRSVDGTVVLLGRD